MKAIFKQHGGLRLIQLTKHECLVLTVPKSYSKEEQDAVGTVTDAFELSDIKIHPRYVTSVRLTPIGKKSSTPYRDGSDHILSYAKRGNKLTGEVVIQGYIYDFVLTWKELTWKDIE